jgi:subtilase family serine protease
MFAQVSTTLADLLMTSVSMPSTVSRTTGFPVAFNVVNQGSTSASAVKLRIYLSRDTKVSADDVVVSRLYWSCIAPKITIPNSITQTLPAGTSAGSYYLLLVVDASGTIAESNEGNNTVVRAIAVK